MSRYTRSVYDEAINDNDNDIDTDAYASLLDNDYNTIINEVPTKESDDKPTQESPKIIDVVIDESSTQDQTHDCQQTNYNEIDYHANKYLIRLVQLLNIFLKKETIDSFQDKSQSFVSNIVSTFKNMFSTDDHTRRISHNCITDFILFKMGDEYRKEKLMYNYVLSDNCIVEQNYNDLFSNREPCDKPLYYIVDTAYNSPEMVDKIVTDSKYYFPKYYGEQSCISEFLKHWEQQKISPFTEGALETFKSLVLNDLPVQCIIADHQYVEQDPRHIYNIDISFVCPEVKNTPIHSLTKVSKPVSVDSATNDDIRSLISVGDQCVISINCPLIMYEENNVIQNLSTFINSLNNVYLYLKHQSYYNPTQPVYTTNISYSTHNHVKPASSTSSTNDHYSYSYVNNGSEKNGLRKRHVYSRLYGIRT